MKKLLHTSLLIGFALALGACAAQQSAVKAPDAQPPVAAAGKSGEEVAGRSGETRSSDRGYVSSALERRDVTGSRINRVRRRSEPAEDTTAGKRVETISGDQIDELQERGYDGLSDILPAGD